MQLQFAGIKADLYSLDGEYVVERRLFAGDNRLDLITAQPNDIEVANLPWREQPAYYRVHRVCIAMERVAFALHAFDAVGGGREQSFWRRL